MSKQQYCRRNGLIFSICITSPACAVAFFFTWKQIKTPYLSTVSCIYMLSHILYSIMIYVHVIFREFFFTWLKTDSQSDGSNGSGQENYACIIGDCKKPDLEDALKVYNYLCLCLN